MDDRTTYANHSCQCIKKFECYNLHDELQILWSDPLSTL